MAYFDCRQLRVCASCCGDWIINVAVTALSPGVREVELNVAVAPGGKPLTESAIELLKGPPTPVPVIVTVALCPRGIIGVGETRLRVKSPMNSFSVLEVLARKFASPLH